MKTKEFFLNHFPASKKSVLLFLVLSVSLFGCKQETIHFSTSDTGKIYIPLEIEGKSYSFCFDTGASRTLIDDKYKDSIFGNSRITAINKIVFWEDTIALNQYSPMELTIGRFQTQASFLLGTYNKVNVNVLGMDVISHYYWCFDFDEKIATISEFPLSIKGAKKLELNYYIGKGGNIHVTIPVNEQALDLLFDTGFYGVSDSSGAIAGTEMTLFIDKDSLNAKRDSNNTDVLFQKNSEPDYFLIIKELAIDKYSLKYPFIHFLASNNTWRKKIQKSHKDASDGYITSEFLRRYSKFCIDPVRKKLEFYDSRPTKEESTKKIYDLIWSSYKEQK